MLYTYGTAQDRLRRVDVASPRQGAPLSHARSAPPTTDAQRHCAQYPPGTRRGVKRTRFLGGSTAAVPPRASGGLNATPSRLSMPSPIVAGGRKTRLNRRPRRKGRLHGQTQVRGGGAIRCVQCDAREHDCLSHHVRLRGCAAVSCRVAAWRPHRSCRGVTGDGRQGEQRSAERRRPSHRRVPRSSPRAGR